ncbi:universal stress protein Slr1101-like [Hydractinia symbiolongicarpus]|uniref:universal stress protein Slr1101-like n=1 Tax=Hydractinia symbiolongicarpus TaxID=13093 RepID=UPI00254B625E|nr:universal stress protein Slr1101-like [Hydractinia symbiolongicarpus]
MASSENKLKLICVDGSVHSDRAVEWFFDNVYMQGDEVGIAHIHVLPDMPSFGFYAHPNMEKISHTKYFKDGEAIVDASYQERIQNSVLDSQAVVEKYKEMVKTKGVEPHVFVETMHDSVGHTLCKLAKKNHAKVIVIGQRGLGTVRRTLFGSVSDYVLHHTHIPVIVVMPE